MQRIYPSKLKKGDTIRIIVPSISLPYINQETQQIALDRFKALGLDITFGKHVEEKDDFQSSSIKSRIEDFNASFADPNVKAVIAAIGGFNSNQLLDYIDWDLVKNNPKIFCGYSDITALVNAIYAKTGLVTYLAPDFYIFGQKKYFDYPLEYFQKCLMDDKPYEINPSEYWSDDDWHKNQDDRNLIENNGYLVINEGETTGTAIGGNQCTLNLLQGTEYMPSLKDSILFLEDDHEVKPQHFDRDLQSLIHLPDFKYVKSIVIGRFQKASEMTNNLLTQIIKTKKELEKIPVIANADFSHTDPMTSIPIGGKVRIVSTLNKAKIEVLEH